ncbi:MAG: uroporphyrinogen-III C-methyltransferase [Clostridiales Family XIII bacterium]|jgi:uroporphyrinogen III methyltransferase/synthase|nr:uroporphyrinogen-III C-methyltransferase [Clostridiales Family XIII bacterium]
MKETARPKGHIWLVGAGPGDAGLLTRSGERALARADVVLFDHLVGRSVLALIPEGAECIFVGKEQGFHTVPQERINALLREKAAEGKCVVRLKGGDPFLFGRGGEELEGLKAAGIPFEVVPGVTSAIAVPAAAGIPASHRDFASQVHIVTGHTRHAPGDGIDYAALAQAGGTLIFLMGVTALTGICEGLLAAGMPGGTPAAVVQQGYTAGQKRVLSTLAELPGDAEAAGVRPPAVTVIGGVCSLAESLDYLSEKPLFGVSVAVARPKDRGSKLTHLLSGAGAEAVEIPSIRTVAIERPWGLTEQLAQLAPGDWVAFTSPVAPPLFFTAMRKAGCDVRALQGVRFAAIGSATAARVESHALPVDLVPAHYMGEALGEALAEAIAREGGKVLLPRSARGTDEILRPLRAAGVDVREVTLYDTVPPRALRGEDGAPSPLLEALAAPGFDWIAFTSASTVEGMAEILGEDALRKSRALCIGEQTRQAAERYGMETRTAPQATLEAMVDTLVEAVRMERSGGHA